MDETETKGRIDHPKVTWQYLLHLLMGTEWTPHQILCYLHVPPSRLRRLLRSKRLNQHLATMQRLSTVRAGHLAVCYSDQAVRTLLRLMEKGDDAISRNASRDLLGAAGNVLKDRTGPVVLDEATPDLRLEQKTGRKLGPLFPTAPNAPQAQKTPSTAYTENASHAEKYT